MADKENPHDSDKFPALPENPDIMQLIRGIGAMSGGAVRAQAQKAGLKMGYRDILFHLAHGLDGCIQYDLVKKIGVSPPTVSVALSNMEYEGLVTRLPDEKDMRSMHVFLTSKGRAIDDALKNVIRKNEEMCRNGLSDEEITALKSLLTKIYRNFAAEESNIENI